jgi:hypothetical protein
MTVGDSKKAPSELLAQLRVVYESGYVQSPRNQQTNHISSGDLVLPAIGADDAERKCFSVVCGNQCLLVSASFFAAANIVRRRVVVVMAAAARRDGRSAVAISFFVTIFGLSATCSTSKTL